MGIENLLPAEGSTSNRKRVGRGQGSGTGKTAARGQIFHVYMNIILILSQKHFQRFSKLKIQ